MRLEKLGTGEMSQWYTGPAPGTLLSGSLAASASQTSPKAVLETEVSGQKVELEGAGTECVECKIENSGGVTVGSGELRFTGITVVSPAGCTVSSTFRTKLLSITADWMIGTVDYFKLVPAAGEENGVFTLELGGGEACPFSTAIIPKGSLFLRAENETGTQAVFQSVRSSAAINGTAGGRFHIGAHTASLEGTAVFTVAGGVAYGTR